MKRTKKNGIIGAARLKSIITDYTASDKANIGLVLDSGDLFHGLPFATLVQGASVAKLMKACGYDAMTAGNHDWNYGKDRLTELSALSGMPILAGNVMKNDDTPFFSSPFLVKEETIEGRQLKVGVLGVIDPTLYKSTAPSNVEGIKFTDSAACASKTAKMLREQENCDIVIALSHTYDPESLASKVSGVDLWLAGHEHKDINTSVQTPDGSTSFVMENANYLSSIGLIELKGTFDEQGNVTDLTCTKETIDYAKAKNYTPDADVQNLMTQIKGEQEETLNKDVGKTPVSLDGDWYQLRLGETNLGRVVTDAYLMETGADIAFENAGGIRASIKSGTVTYGDIIGVSPFGNYIVTKEITGRQLLDILETVLDIQVQAVASYNAKDENTWPKNSGSYLQCGGLTVTYDPALSKGSRVLSVMIGDAPLENDRLYTVATNNYVAVSKDFPELAQAEEKGQFSACDEALIRYFQKGEEAIENSTKKSCMILASQTPNPPKDPEESNPSGKPDTPAENTPPAEEVQVQKIEDKKTPSPQTGDSTMPAVYLLLMAVSAGVFIAGKKQRMM